jgi:hypothetical protein
MERRKQRRQSVAFPLEIFQVGEEPIFRVETTRDMSSGGGVSFYSSESLPLGSKVKYRLTLSGGSRPVVIDCVGRVLRCGAAPSAMAKAPYEIAVTMESYRFIAAMTAS